MAKTGQNRHLIVFRLRFFCENSCQFGIFSGVHVEFVGEVDTIVLPIISIDNGWSPFVTSPRRKESIG